MVMRQLDMIEPELPLDGGSFWPEPSRREPAAPIGSKPRAVAPDDFALVPPPAQREAPQRPAPEPFTLPI
jgi:hypothetical protein